MDRKKYTAMNKEAWNEAMDYHRKAKKQEYLHKFKDPNYTRIHPIEKKVFEEFGVEGKRIAHVCCNNGIELISLTRLGAKRSVGFDISEAAIADAAEYNQIAQTDCHFIQSDVYDIDINDTRFSNQFDFVYISVGALCWIPDLTRFFEICSGLLKDKGFIIIFEVHPFANMLGFPGEPDYDPKTPLNPVYSYFRIQPFEYTDGIDYVGGEIYESKPHVNFTHILSAIVNNLRKSSIYIEEMQEFSEDIATTFGDLPKAQRIPLSLLIIGQKLLNIK